MFRQRRRALGKAELRSRYRRQCRHVCHFFFFQAEDGIRDLTVTGVQTCALPILMNDSATQSTPASRQASRSERSFSVSAENPIVVSGRLTPLRAESLPPTSTRVTADRKSVV